MRRVKAKQLVVAALCALVLTPAALAQSAPTKLSEGVAQLPTTGLVIELPAKRGVEYRVSGSWALTDNGASFDTRDVVDEIDVATGNLVAGNWVLAGYFTAGGCDRTIAAAQLDASWTQDTQIWDETWTTRGGVFTFEGALGRRPAVVLCREKEDGPTLLLYHFLANKPETTLQADVIQSARDSAPLASASKAFADGRTNAIYPTRRTDVRNRGTQPASRLITTPTSGLRIELPPDGYLWMPEKGDGADLLERLLPVFPEVTIEAVVAPNISCVDVFGSLQSERREAHRPLALPSGWLDGPALVVEGETELTVCHAVGTNALVVGVFQGPDDRDVSSLHPILGALLAAALKQ